MVLYGKVLGMNIVTPKKFAKDWDINLRTVYNLIKRGQLPAVKLGRIWRIDLDKIIAEANPREGINEK